MKKNYILLSGLVLASCLSFAQNAVLDKFAGSEVDAKLSAEPTGLDPDFLKSARFNQKVFGDTITDAAGVANFWDFNGGTQGWTVTNNMANNFQWQFATTYQAGQFSAAGNIITSTSAANGFMSLTADFFNTPIPPGGAVAMDTYFESPSIDLTNNGANPGGLGSVWVSYQQAMRYCCSGANRLVLQVSNDNFVTFQEYDASNAIAVNAASGTFSNVINISSAAANQTSITMRFYSEGNSHYYWMIDDIAVIEGPSFDMEIQAAFPEFHIDSFAINPFYSQMPLDLFPALPFSATIRNNGGSAATNPRLEVDVTNTMQRTSPTAPLTAGLGLVYSTTSSAGATLLSDSASAQLTDTINRFVPTVLGTYTFDFLANSDDVDENLGNEADSYDFEITNTVLARDDDGLGGGVGPGSFVRGGSPGGTAVGDRFVNMFVVDANPNAASQTPIPTSISFLVSTDVTNIGVEIVPKIFAFDENAATLAAAVGAEVASSFLPYIVQAQDTNTWITLDFDNGTGFFNGLAAGQYLAGWETTSIAGGTNFEVQNDQSSGSRQPGLTTLLDFGHSPGWGTIAPTNPGIRLNFDSIPLVTSVNNIANTKAEFSVSPNPNNGQFRIDVATNANISYNLVVRNMLGQSVHTEAISVNGQMTKQLDLRAFEKGIYFVSLENEAEKVVKKVIIK